MGHDGRFPFGDEQGALEHVVPQPGRVIGLNSAGGIQGRPLGHGLHHFLKGTVDGVDDNDPAAALQQRDQQRAPLFCKIRILVNPFHALFRMEQQRHRFFRRNQV